MKTAFDHIGDADTEAAQLTNAAGYDVATLERVTVRTPGLPKEHELTPEEWQHIIDMVNHAPAMARFIVDLRDKLNRGISPLPSDDFWNPARIIAADLEN